MKFSPSLTVYLHLLNSKGTCPSTHREWKQYISNVFEQILKESTTKEEGCETAYAFIDAIPERLSYIRENLIYFLPL